MASDAPIILIGTQRSGTTWLGWAFEQHPGLAYWVEPRHVWTRGHAYRGDDVLTAADATPAIAAGIRRRFATFVRERGKHRLCEKTPSNCLRLPFIRAVYPEAKIIHVVRDGRAVFRSTDEILRKGVPMFRVWNRLRETPVWEWPAYAQQAGGVLARKLGLTKKLAYWGPRPPGWRRWVRDDPQPVILARQWAATITAAWEDGHAMGDERYTWFHYDDVMARPREVLTRVCEWAEIVQPEPIIAYAERTADPARAGKWLAELDPAMLEQVRPHMEPTLRMLGYEW